MLHSNNRVQAIKSKFENLSSENEPLVRNKSQKQINPSKYLSENEFSKDKENNVQSKLRSDLNIVLPNVKPNTSYLYSSDSESKTSLTRQSSDPGKKLQRRDAFRCDRNIKLPSPKRHGSCYGRPQTSKFSTNKDCNSDNEVVKPESCTQSSDNLLKSRKSSASRHSLENLSTTQSSTVNTQETIEHHIKQKNEKKNSIPNELVPKHILDQYAQVSKPKNNQLVKEKNDLMTDSGVSSETETVDEDRKREDIITKPNLFLNKEISCSSETIRLERKNPHLKLTDTLKKALKQPLPNGPPPKKPPRIFNSIPESPKTRRNTREMLNKLEQVLKTRDSVEDKPVTQKPKEIHYLCTEILDITNRTLLPTQTGTGNILTGNVLTSCFNTFHCGEIKQSITSLPYTRQSTGSMPNKITSFSSENLSTRRLSTFGKPIECFEQQQLLNEDHIYDVPDNDVNEYGKLGVRLKSRSLEEIHMNKMEEKIYDIPCDISRPCTPETPQTNVKKIKSNFEFHNSEKPFIKTPSESRIHTKSIENLRFSNAKSFIEKFNNNISEDLVGKNSKKEPKRLNANTSIDNNLKEHVKKNDDFDKKIDITNKNYFDKQNKSADNSFFNKTDKTILNTDEIESNMNKDDEAGRSLKDDDESHRSNKNDEESPGIGCFSLQKKKGQIDIDKENLNQLMDELYCTVAQACKMSDRPNKFPTESSDSTSEDSIKLTRSLTEKRKNYIRRHSSRAAYLDRTAKRQRNRTSICYQKEHMYSTFRSYKIFKSQTDLNMDLKKDLDVIDKAGCCQLRVPERNGVFDVCLLVGLNYMTGQAYVKSVFPKQVQVPPHVENLVFPETMIVDSSSPGFDYEVDFKKTQCYSMVLTDEKGDRNYGYCRRVLPEGAGVCLPLCYCIIGKYRAPGFYYKVLKEIESHHGSSELEVNNILKQLYEKPFPRPGEELNLTFQSKIRQEIGLENKLFNNNSILKKTKSFDKNLQFKNVCKDLAEISAMTDSVLTKKVSCDESTKVRNDENANDETNLVKTCEVKKVTCDENLNVSHEDSEIESKNTKPPIERCKPKLDITRKPDRPKTVIVKIENNNLSTIKRPIEYRVDEWCVSTLLETMGAGLVIKIFGSLILERKVILMSDDLCLLSSCMEGLQQILYPFVWQQPLISTIPYELRKEILEAPLPILAGLFKNKKDEGLDLESVSFEEGLLIDMSATPPKLLHYMGDESTILPTNSYKTLKTTLQLEARGFKSDKDTKTSNVMISEAFLRCFMDLLGGYKSHFVEKDGVFEFQRDTYVKSANTKQKQYFLEWFVETSMFHHFIQNMSVFQKEKFETCSYSTIDGVIDAPLPDFYEIFHLRTSTKSTNVTTESKTPYKNAVNRKIKNLKAKLKELVT